MINISKQKVDLSCPKCGRPVSVTIRQITDEVLITCSCGQGIKLKDSNGSNKRAINDANKAINDLKGTFKKLGR